MGSLTTQNAKPGMKVRAYGFDCLPSDDETVTLHEGKCGLYFPCRQGTHWLDGQLDDDSSEYVGLDLISEG